MTNKIIFSTIAIKNLAKARKAFDRIAPFIASYQPVRLALRTGMFCNNLPFCPATCPTCKVCLCELQRPNCRFKKPKVVKLSFNQCLSARPVHISAARHNQSKLANLSVPWSLRQRNRVAAATCGRGRCEVPAILRVTQESLVSSDFFCGRQFEKSERPCDFCSGMVASPVAATVVTAISRCDSCAAKLPIPKTPKSKFNFK